MKSKSEIENELSDLFMQQWYNGIKDGKALILDALNAVPHSKKARLITFDQMIQFIENIEIPQLNLENKK